MGVPVGDPVGVGGVCALCIYVYGVGAVRMCCLCACFYVADIVVVVGGWGILPTLTKR